MAKSKKVNKWEAAPKSIRKLKEAINGTADGLSITGGLDDANEWERELIDILEKVLCDYNELEAKHNADCGLISKLEVENRNYENLVAELHCDVDELERANDNLVQMVEYHKGEVANLVKTADKARDKHENEVRMLKKDISDLQVKVKYYKEDIEDLECKIKSLSKQITIKNAEMCNLKWESDETEKKIKILTEELKRQYNINVTFYQKPGIDMHGIKNFGVNVDCEENRKAFNDLKEALDKYKAKNEKLEDKHAKATRFISRLTEALNDVGIDFHYVKIGDDGEEIFHIDSVVDKCAKKHYEEQFSRLRDTIKNYEEQIRCFKKDIDIFNHRTGLLFVALDRAGIRPSFDNVADKWRIQYTGKAENAFLAADQIKRDAEKKIDKLVSTLDKCHLDAKWDHKNDKWCIRIQPSDTELTSVSVDLCEVIEGYNKLIKEIENLKSKNREWQIRYNFKLSEGTPCGITNCPKVEALKKRLNAIYGYRDTDNPCGICKNFDPKE